MTSKKAGPKGSANTDPNAPTKLPPAITDWLQRFFDSQNAPNGKGWVRLWEVLKVAESDPVIAASPGASLMTAIMIELVGDGGGTAAQALLPLDGLLPKGEHGAKFPGRKKGAVGPVKTAVLKVLKKNPSLSTAEVWAAIKKKPTKGMVLYETPRFGKYIETEGAPETKYARFANIVSEVKKGARDTK